MTTTEITTNIKKQTWKAMAQRRPGEKLGLDCGLPAMLFPTPALDDTQSQEQKKKSQAEREDHGPGIHNAAGEVMHLLEEIETYQHLAPPARVRGELRRQEPQQENARPKEQAHHRRDDLAARQCRRATTH